MSARRARAQASPTTPFKVPMRPNRRVGRPQETTSGGNRQQAHRHTPPIRLGETPKPWTSPPTIQARGLRWERAVARPAWPYGRMALRDPHFCSSSPQHERRQRVSRGRDISPDRIYRLALVFPPTTPQNSPPAA